MKKKGTHKATLSILGALMGLFLILFLKKFESKSEIGLFSSHGSEARSSLNPNSDSAPMTMSKTVPHSPINFNSNPDNYTLSIDRPMCIAKVKNNSIKKIINDILNQISKKPTWPLDVQNIYVKAMDVYGQNILNSKTQLDRICLLELLVSLAQADSEQALVELMADWFNGKRKPLEIRNFQLDLKLISTSNLNFSETFIKVWIGKLRQYSQSQD